MKFTLVLPLNSNSFVKCAGLFCACNRGVLRLQTGAVLEPGCCRARCATTRFWSRQCVNCLEIAQLQFLDVFVVPVVMQRQVPGFLRTVHRCSSWFRSCLTRRRYPWRFHRCSSWTRILTCPFSTTRAHGFPDSAVLGQRC